MPKLGNAKILGRPIISLRYSGINLLEYAKFIEKYFLIFKHINEVSTPQYNSDEIS